MSNYGTAGMPKVVVLGGTSHTVCYNQNNSAITTSGIQGGITCALAAAATGIKENNTATFSTLSIFPNPANTECSLSFNLAKDAKVKIEILNLLGQKVSDVFNGDLQKGENTIKAGTAELSTGNYFVNFSDGEVSKKIKLIIVR
jgi:hypothetical protein